MLEPHVSKVVGIQQSLSTVSVSPSVHVVAMASRGQPLSITLPRNFTFHYTDALPKTPEPLETITTPVEPPAPPKVRIRRRRQVVISGEHVDYTNLPTIEFPDNDVGEFNDHKPQLQNAFLSPFPVSGLDTMFAPPVTPVGQVPTFLDTTIGNVDDEMDSIHFGHGESIVRPSSAWSEISDSSTDTDLSETYSPSFGDSCTSPEIDQLDPFMYPNVREKLNRLSSPLTMHRQARRGDKTQGKVKWTNDMEDHLWFTYMTYLSDPTVTPFKMLPGTAPPLGVCHRVAREAKKNWKGPRNTLDSTAEQNNMRLSPIVPSYVPNFSRPILRTYSTSEITRKMSNKWPRSASSTRRRLRDLCKRKPSLAPHYQRLMASRTPSPFEPMGSESQPSSHSNRFASPPPPPPPQSGGFTPPPPTSGPSIAEDLSCFSTRELNITLATSTATSMQPGGPLSQLAQSEDRTIRRRPWSHQPTARVSAHQKSQSLQLELGLGSRPRSYNFGKLASPFAAPSLPQSWMMRPAPSPIAEDFTYHVPAPPQQPDFTTRIHAPRPLSASMKRRAHYSLGEEAISKDVDVRRSWLEGLFKDSVRGETEGQRRVRNRGFSMSAVKYAPSARHSRHLSEIFSPPSMTEQGEASSSIPPVPPLPEMDRLPLPPRPRTLRLGSPFAPHLAKTRYSNTFPRNSFPQGLDGMSPFDDVELSAEPPSGGSSSTIRY